MKNVYEFKYGPYKHKMIFQESPSLIGVQFHEGNSIEKLDRMLIENAIEVGSFGSYRIFQIFNKNADEIIKKTSETYPSIKTTHVYHIPNEEAPFVPTGKIYIKFKQSTSTKTCLELLEKYHLTQNKPGFKHTFFAQTTDNPLALTVKLQNDSDVEIAEPELATTLEKRSTFG